MKKNVLLLILILGLTVNSVFSQEQLLISTSGNNAKISIIRGNNIDNKFSVFLNLQWVDDDLNPVSDNKMSLVLHKDNIKIEPEGLLICDNFKNENILEFNENIELSFSYTDLSSTEEISFSLDFQKRETGLLGTSAFAIKNPQSLSVSYTDFDPPYITITNPAIKRGFKSIIDLQNIKFIGSLTDVSEINYLKVNGHKVAVTNNRFSVPIRLEEGANIVIVEAKDANNNSVTQKYEIEYLPPLEKQDIANLNYHALIIGVEDYEDIAIGHLSNPINDAQKLCNVLTEKYLFDSTNVHFLKNPTRLEIIEAFESLANKLGSTDNLLIFYAGHGYWDENKKLGYWLPSDASKSNPANWVRNSTIQDYISVINTQHTLLIADACFSGSIFRTRKAFADATLGINKLYELPSRKAMTSGTLKEVPDESVFLKLLVKRLEKNEVKYISAESIFVSFKEGVLNNSPNIPQFGTIQNVGDEGGDFIFIKRD